MWEIGRLSAVVILIVLAGCGSNPDENLKKRIARAETLRAEGKVNAALLELKSAAQEFSDSSNIRVELARFYLRVGAGAEADKEISKATGLAPATRDPILIEALLLQSKPEDALKLLQSIGNWQESAQLTALYAAATEQQGDLPKAQLYFEDALALDPKHSGALLGLAEVFARQSNQEKALPLLAQVRAADPSNAAALLLEGELALAREDGEAGLTAFAAATAVNPFTAQPLAGTVRSYLALERYPEALATLAQATKKFPNNLQLVYLRGLTHYLAQNAEQAVDQFRKVLSEVPNHPGSLFYLGVLMLKSGKLEQAQDYLQAFLNQHPEYLPVRKLLAAVGLRRNRAGDALAVLETLGDNDANVLMLRGTALNQLGRVDEGLADMKRAAELSKSNELVQTSLIMAQIGSRKTDDLIPTLEADARSGSENAEVSAVWAMLAFLSREEWQNALEFYAKLPQDQRELPAIINAVGMAHAGNKDAAAARQAFAQGLAKSPKSGAILGNLAALEINEGNLDAAAEHVAQLRELAPSDANTLTLDAKIENLRQKPEAALVLLESARSSHPKHIESRLMLGAAYLQRDDAVEAEIVAREVLALRSGDVTAMMLLADALARTGKLDEADAIATRVAVTLPNQLLPMLLAGTIKLRLGLSEDAKPFLERALTLDPKNPQAAAGLAFITLGDPEADLAVAIERLASIEGDSARVLELRGDVLARASKYALAAEQYSAAFAKNNALSTAVKLHYAQMRDGDLGGAISGLEQLLAEDPKDAQLLTTLGPMLEQAGRSGEAVAVYERLLKSQPSSTLALNNIALLKQAAGAADAEDFAARAYESDPNSAVVADTYGWILATRGKSEMASKLLKQAVETSQSLPIAAQQSIRYHYAVALVRFEDRDGAISELRTALAQAGEFAERKSAQELLDSLAPRGR